MTGKYLFYFVRNSMRSCGGIRDGDRRRENVDIIVTHDGIFCWPLMRSKNGSPTGLHLNGVKSHAPTAKGMSTSLSPPRRSLRSSRHGCI